MDGLLSSIRVAGSGLTAQSSRIRVVSENIANANSLSTTPGGSPYQRKIISFFDELNRESGENIISAPEIRRDDSPFPTQFDPGNPAADENGFVKTPNVNVIIEMADMREANRSYEANIQVIRQARDLISMTLDLMRSS